MRWKHYYNNNKRYNRIITNKSLVADTICGNEEDIAVIFHSRDVRQTMSGIRQRNATTSTRINCSAKYNRKYVYIFNESRF